MQSRVKNGCSFLLGTRQRKIMFILFFAAFGGLYYFSKTKNLTMSAMRGKSRQVSSSPCAQTVLSQWDSQDDSDVSIFIPSHFHSPPFQFIGNGWIGSSVGSTGVYISHEGYLSVPIPLSPFVEASINGHKMSHEASIIEFKKGFVHHIYVHTNYKDQCVTLQDTVYAHRTHSHLIMQELHFQSGMSGKIMGRLSHIALNSWTGSTRRKFDFKGSVWSGISHYHVVSGNVRNRPTEMSLAMASTDPPETFSLGNHGVSHIHLASVVVYNTSSVPQETLEIAAGKELETLVSNKPGSLRSLHSAAWEKSGLSSVAVSDHHDSSIPQQSTISASLYYAKSALTPSGMIQSQDKQKQHETQCYTGLPTMRVASLWTVPSSSSGFMKLIGKWRSQLLDGNCLSVFTNGHTNIDQSIVRSFIGLQDTGQLLQLAANPLILQTQVTITRFLYQKHFLTLTITVNRQQQPVKMRIMAIQADNKQAIRPLFACEAGCKSDPTELKPNSPVELPVITTSPATPFLFISADRSSLEELSKQLHISKAEQHSDDHEASSDHLSARFWVCLGLLVAAFHIFLLRLVYKEYFYGAVEGTKAKIMSKP